MIAKDFTFNEAIRLSDSLTIGLKKSGPAAAGMLNQKLASLEPAQQILAAISLASERIAMADDKSASQVIPVVNNPPLDTRPVLPEKLRPVLFRVVGKSQTSGVIWETLYRSVYRHLAASGFRLHPFDLCRLEKFLHAVPVKAGSYEHWYLQCLESPQPKPAVDEINWDNWQLYAKAEQGMFLRQQRAVDAEATRLSIAKDFGNAAAALRQLYVEAMETGLSPGDKTFLESLATDRSAKVIEAANRLLARFPESEAATQKRIELKQRLTVHLLSRKFTLVKQKGKKASELLQELYALTEHMAIDDIAAGLGLIPEDLPGKIDQELAFPFARAAAFSKNYGIALLLLQMEDEKILLNQINTITGWFKNAADPFKLRLIERLIPLMANADQLLSNYLLAIYNLMEQALQDKLATTLLNSKAFKTTCNNAVGDNQYLANANREVLALTAVLMPPATQLAYSSKLAEIPFRLNPDPSAYLAFITMLDQHKVKKE